MAKKTFFVTFFVQAIFQSETTTDNSIVNTLAAKTMYL